HKGAKKGQIYETWMKAKHAKAFETLGTPEAKKIAEKKGLKSSPQEAPECLACHVTGYKEAAAATLTKEEGVSCEACHGPGSAYKSMKVMKGVRSGKLKAADYGLVFPQEKTCVACHNSKSPTFKEFKFAVMKKKIEHHIPKK
ncbi:MAG: cytochrome C554, partial [Calditrichaeota bacterium]|nr:cytochrome C554 [Calditrichota bacterium]